MPDEKRSPETPPKIVVERLGEEIVSTLDSIGWTDISADFVECLVTRLGSRLGFRVEVVGYADEG